MRDYGVREQSAIARAFTRAPKGAQMRVLRRLGMDWERVVRLRGWQAAPWVLGVLSQELGVPVSELRGRPGWDE